MPEPTASACGQSAGKVNKPSPWEPLKPSPFSLLTVTARSDWASFLKAFQFHLLKPETPQ